MYKIVFIVYAISQLWLSCNAHVDNLTIVETNYGKVNGIIMHSRESRPFYAYRGIPFAKPPVGPLRFRNPVPPDPWEGVLLAINDAPKCIQKNYMFNEHPPVEGVEDCLYINVYTPILKKLNTPNILLPVMVFIHFGGFFAGTARSDYFGPEYFMDKDIVLVTFNYRLSVFGFLSTNDDAAAGNWGLKDQLLALKWVHDNIAEFGGDRHKVTIFGESAGAASVHYHLLNPKINGLFQKAISQSGSSLALWARPNNALQVQVAKVQARYVNCDPESDTIIMIECLRKVDANVLANSLDLFKYFSTEPYSVYGPVIEVKTDLNPDPYITEDPLDILKSGNFKRIPFIIGVLSNEGIIRAAPLLRISENRKTLNENFDVFGPLITGLAISVPSEMAPSVWKNLTDFYLGTDYVDVNDSTSVQGFINMIGDRAFKYGSYQSALLHAWRGHSNVWFYNLDYRGEYSYGDYFASTKETIDFKWGPSHSDDLLYLFRAPRLFPPLKDSNDKLLSKIMIQMWTSFAIKGDPSPAYGTFKIKWSPIPNLRNKTKVTNSDLFYLNIDRSHGTNEKNHITFKMRNNFTPERMRFWENLPLEENVEGLE